MVTLIDMPKLSDTMTVGTLVKWLKNEGDAVTNGDMIAEVETDKATMEVECFEEGVLIKQYAEAGERCLSEELLLQLVKQANLPLKLLCKLLPERIGRAGG